MVGEPRVRCACCGSLARARDFGFAGQHVVEVRRVLRGLGRGRGFEWSTEVAPVPALAMLHAALTRALEQVTAQLDELAAIPAPPCTACGEILTPDVKLNQWQCSGCGAVFAASVG